MLLFIFGHLDCPFTRRIWKPLLTLKIPFVYIAYNKHISKTKESFWQPIKKYYKGPFTFPLFLRLTEIDHKYVPWRSLDSQGIMEEVKQTRTQYANIKTNLQLDIECSKRMAYKKMKNNASFVFYPDIYKCQRT